MFSNEFGIPRLVSGPQCPAWVVCRADARGPAGALCSQEEEEAAQRDWLDWVYTVSRATVLLGIVYFYSSFGRFLVVTGIALLMYLYQGGWLLGPRRQQQQERGHDRNRAREANNEQQPQAAPVAGPREGPQPEGAGAAQLDGAGDQDGDAAVAPPPPPEPRVSPVAMVWTFVATFFTSLIPEQPPPVNAN